MLVDFNAAADDAGVAVKIGMPEGVAQNDVGSAVCAFLVGGTEKAAEIGLNAQGIEVISASEDGPGGGGISAVINSHRAYDLGRCQAFEGLIAVAQVQIVRVGLRWITVPLQHVETLRMGHVHRAQNQSIQDAEHDGVGADAQGEGDNGRQGKARRFEQLT